HPAFQLQPGVGAFAADFEDDLLETPPLGDAGRQQFHPPAFELGVAAVHLEKVGGEQGGFLTPGPAPNLDDHVLGVVRILQHQAAASGSSCRAAWTAARATAIWPSSGSRVVSFWVASSGSTSTLTIGFRRWRPRNRMHS